MLGEGVVGSVSRKETLNSAHSVLAAFAWLRHSLGL